MNQPLQRGADNAIRLTRSQTRGPHSKASPPGAVPRVLQSTIDRQDEASMPRMRVSGATGFEKTGRRGSKWHPSWWLPIALARKVTGATPSETTSGERENRTIGMTRVPAALLVARTPEDETFVASVHQAPNRTEMALLLVAVASIQRDDTSPSCWRGARHPHSAGRARQPLCRLTYRRKSVAVKPRNCALSGPRAAKVAPGAHAIVCVARALRRRPPHWVMYVCR